MNKDILHWTRSYINCQKNKIGRRVKNSPKHFAVPERFQHIHIDIIGLLLSTITDIA